MPLQALGPRRSSPRRRYPVALLQQPAYRQPRFPSGTAARKLSDWRIPVHYPPPPALAVNEPQLRGPRCSRSCNAWNLKLIYSQSRTKAELNEATGANRRYFVLTFNRRGQHRGEASVAESCLLRINTWIPPSPSGGSREGTNCRRMVVATSICTPKPAQHARLVPYARTIPTYTVIWGCTHHPRMGTFRTAVGQNQGTGSQKCAKSELEHTGCHRQH